MQLRNGLSNMLIKRWRNRCVKQQVTKGYKGGWREGWWLKAPCQPIVSVDTWIVFPSTRDWNMLTSQLSGHSKTIQIIILWRFIWKKLTGPLQSKFGFNLLEVNNSENQIYVKLLLLYWKNHATNIMLLPFMSKYRKILNF